MTLIVMKCTILKNNGAFCNEKTISVSKISEKSKASLTTGFPASTSVNDSIEFLEDLYSWKKLGCLEVLHCHVLM